MSTNSEKNSDKEKEAEIAANEFVKMLAQQSLYERIAKINAESKEKKPLLLVSDKKSSRKVYMKWAAIAASLVLCALLFLFNNKKSTSPKLAVTNTEFRGIHSTQSRTLINGKEARTDYADIDDMIELGNIKKATEMLDELSKSKGLSRSAPVTYRQGIIAYQAQDFAAAAQAFRQTVDSSDLEYLENAYWNLLLSYKEAKDMDAAKMVAKEMGESPHITEKQKATALEVARMTGK